VREGNYLYYFIEEKSRLIVVLEIEIPAGGVVDGKLVLARLNFPGVRFVRNIR
jgi:hypothetical protein